MAGSFVNLVVNDMGDYDESNYKLQKFQNKVKIQTVECGNCREWVTIDPDASVIFNANICVDCAYYLTMFRY